MISNERCLEFLMIPNMIMMLMTCKTPFIQAALSANHLKINRVMNSWMAAPSNMMIILKREFCRYFFIQFFYK